MPIAFLLSSATALVATAVGGRASNEGIGHGMQNRDNLELSRRDLMIVGAASVAATAVPSPSANAQVPVIAAPGHVEGVLRR